ncbi:response regulator [uncultured Desulfosarcina sp.]|uniref:hybrid sensor histidine kinase/response regulator n=1 Tax=uncultured Desulfosarcina sp. TaxID=218289 RepID=UPI0029C74B70|nr:response regulator [uncultured Desulfosarcina sp.]
MDADQLKQISLILVDDESEFRDTLAKRLLRRGLPSLHASDGKACLAMLAKQPVDVVVMDVMMPGMNGIDTLSEIKRHYQETEVILLTGNANAQDGVKGMKAGAFDYLTKPVEFEHLLGKIAQAYDLILSHREQKMAEEYKARMEQQMIATERLAALGTLAAGVAHEINNPLAIINESAGYLRTVLQKKELAEIPHRASFDKALEKIETSVKRARTITHQLLADAGKNEQLLAEIDIQALVDETVQLIRRDAESKRVRVNLDADRSGHPIWGDPNQIRQVLINLLNNAVHATEDGGEITVRLRSTQLGASMDVIDSGAGIAKENLDRIFEPFFSTKAPGKGTGLGLFVSRDIVEKLGGTLTAESKLGEGSRFRIYIPNLKPFQR